MIKFIDLLRSENVNTLRKYIFIKVLNLEPEYITWTEINFPSLTFFIKLFHLFNCSFRYGT